MGLLRKVNMQTWVNSQDSLLCALFSHKFDLHPLPLFFPTIVLGGTVWKNFLRIVPESILNHLQEVLNATPSPWGPESFGTRSWTPQAWGSHSDLLPERPAFLFCWIMSMFLFWCTVCRGTRLQSHSDDLLLFTFSLKPSGTGPFTSQPPRAEAFHQVWLERILARMLELMLLIMYQMAQTLQVGQTPPRPGSGSNSFEATGTFVHLWVDQKTPFQN